MLVDPVQGPKFIEQILGGFGTYPGDTGDVVRGVAHQGLQINEPLGLKAVFLPKQVLII